MQKITPRPIDELTMKVHFSPSYFVKFLVMIIDFDTGKELHSEEVAVTFLARESKYLRGLDAMRYDDIESMTFWLKANTRYHVVDIEKPHAGIFFTNRQEERFEELVIRLRNHRLKFDACHIETIEKDDALEVKDLVRQLRNNKDSVIWLGEFV